MIFLRDPISCICRRCGSRCSVVNASGSLLETGETGNIIRIYRYIGNLSGLLTCLDLLSSALKCLAGCVLELFRRHVDGKHRDGNQAKRFALE